MDIERVNFNNARNFKQSSLEAIRLLPFSCLLRKDNEFLPEERVFIDVYEYIENDKPVERVVLSPMYSDKVNLFYPPRAEDGFYDTESKTQKFTLDGHHYAVSPEKQSRG